MGSSNLMFRFADFKGIGTLKSLKMMLKMSTFMGFWPKPQLDFEYTAVRAACFRKVNICGI